LSDYVIKNFIKFDCTDWKILALGLWGGTNVLLVGLRVEVSFWREKAREVIDLADLVKFCQK